MARKKNEEETEEKENYFLRKDKPIKFINSGCTLLNKVLGGGWPLGRISNIVGLRSSGKTELAIEAIVNFCKDYPEGEAYYLEGEAAFDYGYAEQLGFPLDKVNFVDDSIDTVEGMYDDIIKIISKNKNNKPIIYVVDSLDSLSDEAERKEEDITKGTYNLGKAKQLSKIFRLITKKVNTSNMHLMIISQLRDNVGVMWGDKNTRSGGKALDYYASQIINIAQKEKINKTVKGIKREYGIWVEVKCKKNKIGMPFRECQFPIIFTLGINDIWASLDWLNSVKNALEEIGLETFVGKSKDKDIEEYAETLYKNWENEETWKIIIAILDKVNFTWDEIEKDFIPSYKKF